MTDRFIIEHGVVHDIKTGRHLTQAIEDDYPQQLCDLLNEQERTIDGYREALLVLVELKRFKRQIEAGTANADMKRYYEANKEGAWLAAEAMLVGCVRTEELRTSGTIDAGLVKAALIWGLHTGVVERGDFERVAISGSFNLNTVAEYLTGKLACVRSPQRQPW